MSILLNGFPTAYRKMQKLRYWTVLLGLFVIAGALASTEEGVSRNESMTAEQTTAETTTDEQMTADPTPSVPMDINGRRLTMNPQRSLTYGSPHDLKNVFPLNRREKFKFPLRGKRVFRKRLVKNPSSTRTTAGPTTSVTMDASISSGQCSKMNEKLRQEIDKKVKFIEQQKSHINKYIEVLKELLIEKANMEKRTARQKFMQDSARLGYFLPSSDNLSDTMKMNGTAINELDARIQKNIIKREEVEKQMELLRDKRPSKSETRVKRSQPSPWSLNGTQIAFSIPQTVLGSYTPQEYDMAQRILQLKLNALKKEEADLLLEKKKLRIEKIYHAIEQRRILSEDKSKFDSYPVLNERYLLLTLLGKGGFAEVYKAFDLKEQRYVACKVSQLSNRTIDWQVDYIRHTLREYNIQRALNHSRIVKSYDAFEIDATTFCTVVEYCGGGDLKHYLIQRRTIPENEAKLIVMQIVSALKYLNEIKPPIIHFDLKPENTLLMEENISGEIKITDFGVSRIMNVENPEQGIELTTPMGTWQYLPFDIMGSSENDSAIISSSVDVWSVGIIFFECLYGTLPEVGWVVLNPEQPEEEWSLELREVAFPDTPTVSEEAKNFIRSCLRLVKEERMNVLTLAQHPYLQPSVPKHGRTRSEYNRSNNSEKNFEEKRNKN